MRSRMNSHDKANPDDLSHAKTLVQYSQLRCLSTTTVESNSHTLAVSVVFLIQAS